MSVTRKNKMCPVKGFCFVLRTALDQNLGAKKTKQNKKPGDLESVILSEIREREISHGIPYTENLKRNEQVNLFTKQKKTHRLRE